MNTFRLQKVSGKHLSLYTLQLTKILQAGIPIVSALEMLSRQTSHSTLKSTTVRLIEKIQEGESLGSSLRSFPTIFPPLFCCLVAIGEQGGVLDQTLETLNTNLDKTLRTHNRIKQILLYPLVVLVVVIATVAFLMLTVVPTFEELFHESGTTLPGLTLSILATSRWLHRYWFDLLCLLVGLSTAILFTYWSYPKAQTLFEKSLRTIPVCKRYIQYTQAIHYGTILASLTHAGIPISEALSMLEASTNNVYQKEKLFAMQALLREGVSLALCCEKSEMFPSIMIEMIQTGENSGTLESMLTNATQYLTLELDRVTDTAKQLLEPAIMILLGILVGTLIIGLYLPLFQIGALSQS